MSILGIHTRTTGRRRVVQTVITQTGHDTFVLDVVDMVRVRVQLMLCHLFTLLQKGQEQASDPADSEPRKAGMRLTRTLAPDYVRHRRGDTGQDTSALGTAKVSVGQSRVAACTL